MPEYSVVPDYYVIRCEATTLAGHPCPTKAAPGSIYCHVHDADLQCGARKRNGERCNQATGGGRCKHHPMTQYAQYRSA